MSTTTRVASPAVAARLAAEQRRRRSRWAALVAVAVLAAAGAVGYHFYSAKPADTVRIPAGVAAADDTGIARGSGRVTVDLYADFMCPNCKRFEETGGGLLDDLVTQGRATVVVHPVAFLDRMSSGTQYSTRASAAAGCAADGGRFTEYARALFGQQPAENSAGLPDSRLIEIGRSVGLGDGFATCVKNRTYRGWAGHVTDRAARRGVSGTPTVLVNGRTVDADPAKISAAVAGG
jgi:protein-disulfide isomerase